jgi:general stress protein 26
MNPVLRFGVDRSPRNSGLEHKKRKSPSSGRHIVESGFSSGSFLCTCIPKKSVIFSQQRIIPWERAFMQKEKAVEEALALADKSGIAILGTNGENGYPNSKAMIKMENEGLKRIWLSTNTSSKRVGQLVGNPKACVYFGDFEQWMGLMLVGDVDVLRDAESRQRLWRDGFEKYYPLGAADPDYSVLRFTARWGNYYHALSNVTFEL